jgi:hypothetical protein
MGIDGGYRWRQQERLRGSKAESSGVRKAATAGGRVACDLVFLWCITLEKLSQMQDAFLRSRRLVTSRIHIGRPGPFKRVLVALESLHSAEVV